MFAAEVENMAEIVAESLADSRLVAGRKATESPPVSLRRLRLFTCTGASKRARAAELVRALGGNVTTLQQQAVECAAMLTAIAEDLAARWRSRARRAAVRRRLDKGQGRRTAPVGWNMGRSREWQKN